jgi:MFS family permease
VLTDVGEGLRYVGGQRRLRLLVWMFVLVVMVGFPFVTVLPGLVENQLGRDVESISTLFLTSAIGSLAAGLLVARYADSPNALAIYSSLGFAFALGLLALSAVRSYEMAVAAMLLLGAGSGGFHSLSGAVIVRHTDPAFLGRVLSLTLLAFGAFGLAALPMGLLADAVGERGALATSGAGVAAVVAVLRMRLARG